MADWTGIPLQGAHPVNGAGGLQACPSIRGYAPAGPTRAIGQCGRCRCRNVGVINGGDAIAAATKALLTPHPQLRGARRLRGRTELEEHCGCNMAENAQGLNEPGGTAHTC